LPSNIDPVHHGEAERWGGWSWREPRYGEHFRTCSYCGCINPDDLAADQSWRADWADRKYGWPHKFYVDILNRDPGRLFAIGSQSSGTVDASPRSTMGLTWYRYDAMPDELLEIVHATRMADDKQHADWYGFGTRAAHHAKFYSTHLADPGLSDEVRLAIEGRSGIAFDFTPDGRVGWRLGGRS